MNEVMDIINHKLLKMKRFLTLMAIVLFTLPIIASLLSHPRKESCLLNHYELMIKKFDP